MAHMVASSFQALCILLLQEKAHDKMKGIFKHYKKIVRNSNNSVDINIKVNPQKNVFQEPHTQQDYILPIQK